MSKLELKIKWKTFKQKKDDLFEKLFSSDRFTNVAYN